MLEQKVKEYTIKFRTTDEVDGILMPRDAGIIEVFKGDEPVDWAWVVISKNGTVRLERI